MNDDDLRAEVKTIAARIETPVPDRMGGIDAAWYVRGQAEGMYLSADSVRMLTAAKETADEIDQLLADAGALEADALRERAVRLILAAVQDPIRSTPELPRVPDGAASADSWIAETSASLRRWVERDPQVARWRKDVVAEAADAAQQVTGFRSRRTYRDIHDGLRAMIPDADLRTCNAGWLRIVEHLVRDKLPGHVDRVTRIGEGDSGRLEVDATGADHAALAAIRLAADAAWEVCAFCGTRDGIELRTVAYGGRHPHRVCGRHEF